MPQSDDELCTRLLGMCHGIEIVLLAIAKELPASKRDRLKAVFGELCGDCESSESEYAIGRGQIFSNFRKALDL